MLINEAFHPERAKVLAVKEYLDKMFKRTSSFDIVDGYPKKIGSVALMGGSEALKIMDYEEALLMLDDHFHDMIKDDKDRRKFLGAVLKYWYTKDITPEGILPVNVIK